MSLFIKKVVASFIVATLSILYVDFLFEDIDAVQIALPVSLICIIIFLLYVKRTTDAPHPLTERPFLGDLGQVLKLRSTTN